MPPSFYCKPRWIKAGGRSTGHSLAPSTQIQFMNNQSKKCLSEQHCAHTELYQMLLAWFQHEILGLLCGLLFFLPLIYLRQRPDYFGALHTRRLRCHHLQYRFCQGD